MSKRNTSTSTSQDDYNADVDITTSDSPSDDCSNLSFTSSLQDIQQPALSLLVVGQDYSIKLNNNIPKVYNHENNICGTIISLMIAQLIKCLQGNRIFSAKAIELKGDLCTVVVKPA